MADATLAPFLLQFAAAYGCMLLIPGPNMFLVLRAADGVSVRKPLAMAAGVASGAALASILAASSAATLPNGPGFRMMCGLLVAVLLLRAARQSFRPWRSSGARASDAAAAPFLLGLGTALLNPVSVPYFASFFVSHACGRVASAVSCILVFAMAGLWFSSLGLVSARLTRLHVPLAYRRVLDWIVSATLVGLALRSLLAAISM